MISNAYFLAELVDSNPQVGEFLTDRQAYLLDRAIIWGHVEDNYWDLEVNLLEDIHDRNEPMTPYVLEILWELNGSVPVIEGEEDIWL